jgi:hypothetical protein
VSRGPSVGERGLLLSVAGFRGQVEFDPSLDWEFLVPYAQGQLILPALGHAAASWPSASRLPVPLKEELVDAAIHNEVQNQVLLADLADAVAALGEAKIRCIALKGAGLLARFPELVRSRHTDDIDLWVDPLRVFDADGILRARGYGDLAPVPVQPLLYDGSPSPVETKPHQLPGLLSPRGTPLEIHRYPPADEGCPWEDAFSSSDEKVVRGVRIRVRGAAAMLRDLASHVVVHHGGPPSLWPRHLRDAIALESSAGGRSREAAEGARALERVALLVTAQALAGARDPRAEGQLARRLLFPRPSVLSWGWFHTLARVGEQGRRGPRAVARTLWPAEAFLKARGFDPEAGRWQARMAHARDVLARASGSR